MGEGGAQRAFLFCRFFACGEVSAELLLQGYALSVYASGEDEGEQDDDDDGDEHAGGEAEDADDGISDEQDGGDGTQEGDADELHFLESGAVP